MKALLALIKKLYGSKALSKTIGTRTNVITLPDKETKRFLTNELNIEAASDAALEKAYKDVEKLIPEIPKMNDQEILTFTGNLQRLDNRLNPPSAEIIEFGTKQPVSPAGIKQLETELGIPSDVDPQSPLGQIMTKTKQIEKEGKSLAKEFGMEDVLRQGLKGLDDKPKTTDELYEQTRKAIEEPTETEKAFRAKERSRIGQVFDDLTKSQKSFRRIEDEGLVRATVRQILERDKKSGKLKLTEAEDATITFQNQGDPIDIFRKYYGENALEQVDSLAPKFREMRTQQEAADLAQKEFKLEPKADRLPGSFDPENPPEFATGGRVGLQYGGNIYTAYNNYLQEIQNRPQMSYGILSSPVVQDMSSGDTTEQAVADPTNPGISAREAISNMMSNARMGNVNVGRGMMGRAIGGMLAGPIGAMIGGGIGGLGSTKGNDMGVDSVNEGSVAADASAGGAAGAAAASAAGSNDGPGGGTFAEGGRVGLMAGASLKYMIDFILKYGPKVSKKGKMPSKEFLEFMGEKNPQNILNVYEDVKKKAGIIDDPDVLIGQAPKTNLKKVRQKAETDKRITKELAEDNQIPVRDDTIVPEDVITVPEPFKGKYQQEFLAHDALYGRRSGDNKVDAEAIAETVADMQGKVYDDMGYSERMDLYDKAYGYLSLLDRVKGAMKEAKGRTKQAGGGLAYLMGL